MKRILAAIATAAAAAVFISSCHQVTAVPPVGAMTRAPDRDRVIVYIEWTADIDQIGAACDVASLYGCAKSQEIQPGDWKCTVYAQKPSDFNDGARLQVLGHEIFHCFGGQHSNP
jgi:hypothetical protein